MSGLALGRACAIFVVGIASIGFSNSVVAEPPATSSEPGTPLVAGLVRSLGDGDYLVRTRADEQLAKLGVKAKAELERAAADPNPEIRLRAKELLKRLRIEALWQASAIDVAPEGQSAAEIVKKIAEQSGNHVLLGDQYGTFNDQPFELEFEKKEFWPSLDQLARATGNRLRTHYDSRQPGFVLTAGTIGDYPTAYAGPIRAQITSARRSFSEELDYETGKSDRTHAFHFVFQLTWEDRFRLTAYRSQPELIAARTNRGTAISATQPPPVDWSVAGPGMRQMSMTLRLHPPTVAADKLELLALKWGVSAIGDPAELVVEDFASREPHYRDDVELVVEAFDASMPQRCEATVRIFRDAAVEPQEAFFQELEWELVDDRGMPYRKQGQTNTRDEDGAHVKLTFVGDSAEARPKKLTLRYPRIRSQRDVVLTFRDVPLPHARPE